MLLLSLGLLHTQESLHCQLVFESHDVLLLAVGRLVSSNSFDVLGLAVVLPSEDASHVTWQLAQGVTLLIISLRVVIGQKATLQTHWPGSGQWVRSIGLCVLVGRPILVAKVDQVVDLNLFVSLVI